MRNCSVATTTGGTLKKAHSHALQTPGSGRAIVGRDRELALLVDFVATMSDGTSVFLLDGEAGIGKSTLWTKGVELAAEANVMVLSAQPAESEGDVAYAVLGDLLRFVDPRDFDALPGPQRIALRTVALLDDPGTTPIDARTVGVAVAALFARLTADGPTVVAIDDCQWADEESAAALSFAIRRQSDHRVSLLLGRRTGTGLIRAHIDRTSESKLPFDLGNSRALPLSHVVLTGLELTNVIDVVAARSPKPLSRQVLQHLAESAHGNPFLAVQLADASARLDEHDPNRPLVLPSSVGELLLERVARLEASISTLLVTVAVIGQPSIATTAAVLALDTEAARELIDDAVGQELVTVEAGRVRCAHPLLASAVLQSSSAATQRKIHRRVAEIAEDVEEKARHLLFATDPPDPTLATLLDAAAQRAAARGAPLVGATFADRARYYSTNMSGTRSSVDDDVDVDRLMTAGRLYVEAGEPGPARQRFEEVLERLGPGPRRADALIELGRLLQRHGGLNRSAEVLERALREAGDDGHLSASAALWLGFVLNGLERTAQAREHLEAAVVRAENSDDRLLLLRSLTYRAVLRFFVGLGVDEEGLARAEGLVRVDDRINVEMRPEVWRVRFLWYCGMTRDAAASIRHLHRRFLDQGLLEDVVKMAMLAMPIARDLGDADRVRAIADEAQDLGSTLPDDNRFVRAHVEAVKGMWLAYEGRMAEAIASLELALSAFGQSDYGLSLAVIAPAVGFICFSADEPARMHEVLGPLCRRIRQSGLEDPGTMTYLADDIEAQISLGKLDEASGWIAWLHDAAVRFDRPLELLRVERCRALLAAQETRFDEAMQHAERAAQDPVLRDLPWERARTLMVLGQIRRRAKQRTAAGDALRAAREIFAEIGMSGWVTRVGVELERLGLFHGTETDLTPTELQVAELAAAGKSNPDIAAVLFMSRKTVEANLSRIYAKLGIAARAQLRAALDDRA